MSIVHKIIFVVVALFIFSACNTAMSHEDRADQLWGTINGGIQEEICFQLTTFGDFEAASTFMTATHSEKYFLESQEAHNGVVRSIYRNCGRTQ